MREIIVDKSYLDGATSESIAELCDAYIVLLAEELFFELITTSAQSQTRCFSKIPNRENPVTLIPNVGSLLRLEKARQTPCIPLAQHALNIHYEFNQRLRRGTFVWSDEARASRDAWRSKIELDTKNYVERCFVVHQFFPELNGIEWNDFPTAVASSRRKVASNDDFVREIYASFLNENAPPDALAPNLLGPQWIWFRWVQCEILSALRIFARYQGRIPTNLGPEFWRRAEHSMLDVYYVILGSLAGALATSDSEVREDFQLLCPDALIMSASDFRTPVRHS